MKNSKEIRTCIGCRNKFHKDNLIRIVKLNDEVIIDSNKTSGGRGTYLCKDIKCFENVVKTKKLERVLKTNISDKRGVIFDR